MEAKEQLRAILATRLSHLTDATTSPERQLESTTRAAVPYDVVGTISDLDVSAKVSPWDRPDLGPWLKERSGEWDVLIFAKVDRAFRSAKHCADLTEWAESNRKILIFADDGLMLDFRSVDDKSFNTMMAKMFVFLASLFAEMELKRMRDRRTEAHKKAREGRYWPGGPAPYGYVAVKAEDGRMVLEVQEDHRAVVHRVVSMVIGGASVSEVARHLNDSGVPTSRARAANEDTSKEWSSSVLMRMLRRRSLLGVKEHGGRIQRDADGNPIQMADPLISDDTWELLQAALQKLERKKGVKKEGHPFTGVFLCGQCGKLLRHHWARQRDVGLARFRCNRTDCTGGGSIRATDAIAAVTDAFLGYEMDDGTFLGDHEEVRRVYVEGNDVSADLANIRTQITDLREARYTRGEFKGEEDVYDLMMANLVARRDALDAIGIVPSGWRWESTGQTYAQRLAVMDLEGQGDEMRMLGITMTVHTEHDTHILVPGDLLERLRTKAPVA